MTKYITGLLLALCCFGSAVAQKKASQKKTDTVVYYMQNSGKTVSTKDSADYFVVILPPDSAADKNLYVVNEYYPNGKPRLMAGSLTQRAPLKMQGPYIQFFPNGHKMMIGRFEKNLMVGDVLQFYPNGRFYNKRTFHDPYAGSADLLFEDCSDSTGNVLAENGKGRWVNFSDDFKKIVEEGRVLNGQPDSVWRIRETDTSGHFVTYAKGKILKNKPYKVTGNNIYSVIDIPEFPGGLEKFAQFLSGNIHFPEDAKFHKVNGRVIMSFVVEKDGTLSDIKVRRGLGYGCDEEAVRVMKTSPLWIPGTEGGKPVRVQFSVPIEFEAE